MAIRSREQVGSSSQHAGSFLLALLFFVGVVTDLYAQCGTINITNLHGASSICVNASDDYTMDVNGHRYDVITSISGPSGTTWLGETVTWGFPGTYRIHMNGPCGPVDYPTLITVLAVVSTVPTVSGGGALCSGGTLSVMMVTSQPGVTYSLYRNNVLVSGSNKSGGSTLTWTVSTTGTYTVKGSACTSNVLMPGSAVVTDGTVAPTAWDLTAGGSTNVAICPGETGKTLSLATVTSNHGSQWVSYQLQVTVNGVTTNVGSPIVGGPTASLVWPSLTVAGVYSVVGSHCSLSAPMANTVTISNGTPTVFNVTGGGSYCTSAGGATVGLSDSETGFKYQLKRNGAAVGTEIDGTGNALSWTSLTQTGTYTVSARLPACANSSAVMSGSALIPVGYPIPYALFGGGVDICQGNSSTVYIEDSEEGASYQLLEDGVVKGSAIVSAGGPLSWTCTTLGTHTYTVRATSNGCTAVMPGSRVVTIISETNAKKTEESFTHTLLSAAAPVVKKLYLNRCNEQNGVCGRTLRKLKVYARFDLGDVYKWGRTSTSTAAFAFSGHTEFTLRGLDAGGAALFTESVMLDVNATNPEQLFYYEVTSGSTLSELKEIELQPGANPGTGNAYTFTGALATGDIRLKFSYQEEVELDVINAQVTTTSVNAIASNPWEKDFVWTVTNSTYCLGINNFQVQVLKLNPGQVIADLREKDWTQSLSMETGAATTTLRLVLAEGSGTYAWRVRAIGSLPGGITNPSNWGRWSAVATYSGYTQPDENRNWIYSRTFTEGNQISESLVYANGLQQVSQQQTRLQSIGPSGAGNSDQLVVSQTMRDFVGRDALKTLPVPVGGVSTFGYRNNLLVKGVGNPLTATDFDNNPYSVAAAVVEGGYYSGAPQTVDSKVFNDRVADAEGVPYTRTLYTKDGTGRVKEQAGPGSKHSLAGGKTTKTLYTGVSEGELVRLFGNEAPEAGNVQKIITVDANGVSSVQYQNKDGKVLATALDAGTTPTNLVALGTRDGATQTIYEEVKDEVPLGPFGNSSKKPLLFTSNTTVYVDYTITPQMITAICNSPCRTCDYKIEFILYNQEPAGGDLSQTVLQTVTIPGGTSCVSITPTVVPQFNFLAKAATNYVLEKRITANNTLSGSLTYMEDYITQNATAFTIGVNANAVIQQVRTYLTNKDIAGLNTYLDGRVTAGVITFDAALQHYSIPVTVNGCTETIFVPKEDPCPVIVSVPAVNPCPSANDEFEDYFNDYWEAQGKTYHIVNSLYFDNRYKKEIGQTQSQYRMGFPSGTFELLVGKMMSDNPLLTCSEVWDIWISEVESYEDYNDPNFVRGGEVEGPVFRPDLIESTTTGNDLLGRFLSRIDELLSSKNPGDRTADVCSYANTYYLIRDRFYGRLSGLEIPITTVSDVYRYGFYNSDYQAPLLSAYFASIGKSAYNTLTTCERYKFYQIMERADLNSSGTAAKEERRELAIYNCKELCEGRKEEFKQAIIHQIRAQDPGVIIEHYFVSKDTVTNRYVGIYDIEVNDGDSTTVDYTECQIDAMAEALVQNCKNNYCGLTFTGTNLEQLGTTAELEKINKVLRYNFNVQVNGSGTTCAAGWDQIPGAGPYNLNSFKWALKVADANVLDVFMKSDATGNQYLLKSTAPTMPGGNPSNYIIKLEKYRSNGSVLWTKNVITAGWSAPGIRLGDMEIDNAGNVVISGVIAVAGQIDFNPAAASSGEYNFSSSTWSAFFVAKYDANGNYIWSNVLRKTTVFEVLDKTFLEIEEDNSIYFTGSLPLGTIDFDPSAAVYPVTVASNQNIFIARYNGDGTFITASTVAGPAYQTLHSFTRDEAGNLYLFAWVSTGVVDVDLSPNTMSVNVPQGMCILRYSRTLAFSWIKSLATVSGGNGTSPRAIAVDHDMNVYIGGSIIEMVDFDPGNAVSILGTTLSSTLFLAKYDAEGNLLWAQLGPEGEVSALQFNAIENSVYSFGNYKNSFDLDLSANYSSIITCPTGNVKDIFLAKYGADGSFKGGITIGNTSLEKPFAVSVYEQSVYFSNSFVGTLDADASAATSNVTESSGFSALLAKYALDRINCTFTNTLCFQWDTERAPTSIPTNYPTSYIYDPVAIPCGDVKSQNIKAALDAQIDNILTRKRDEYQAQYMNACVNPSSLNDQFFVSYALGLHHFTLYYYDRAGNLMRSVPPEGVYAEPPAYGWGTSPALNPTSLLKDVSSSSALATARTQDTNYRLITEYQYNSLGQVIRQHTPDANDPINRPLVTASESVKNASKYYGNFFYDDQGRLRFSQNTKQKTAVRFSYTKYDALNRVIEVGESPGYVEATLLANRNNANYPATGGVEITRTFYTTPYSGGPSLPVDPRTGSAYEQRYLRNRVSYTYTDDDGLDATLNDRIYTIYSYDPHGNVEWLVQGLPEVYATNQHAMFAIRYEYDLLNGNVKQVSYNPGREDQFFHEFQYDADKRINKVRTSKDGKIWDREALYSYYPHGPLKRTVLGEDKVQGVDYTYTIHGWMKAINAPWGTVSHDPGSDGATQAAARDTTALDVFGMELGYYNGDYRRKTQASPIVYSVFDDNFPAGATAANLIGYSSGAYDVYNGNISTWMSYQVPKLVNANNTTGITLKYDNQSTGSQYRYDELNRIKFDNQLAFNTGTWSTMTNNEYYTEYSYRPNGNLTDIVRNADTRSAVFSMDQFQYWYVPATNQLDRVVDASPNTSTWTEDIDAGQAINNYWYDGNGRIIKDLSQNINNILWTVYDKVKGTTNSVAGTSYAFSYDASGNRVIKKFTSSTVTRTNYYVRDAQGNTLAVYRKQTDAGGTTVSLDEASLYGSDRVGSYTPVQVVTGAAYSNSSSKYTRMLGLKLYEMKDHLGNVRALVTDQRERTGSGASLTFKPTLRGLYNYYPFGMEEPQRAWVSSNINKYNYGYNGKEKDDDGEFSSLTSYDYGFRVYNPGIARFLSIDPLMKSYPMLTPYQFASNTPIAAIDLDGLEALGSTKGRFDGAYWTMGSDNHISLAHEAELKMQAQQALVDKPFIPNYGILKSNDIYSTPQGKVVTQMIDDYGNLILPLDVSARLIKGEEVPAWEIGVEVASILPLGKLVKPLKYLGESIPVVAKIVKNSAGDEVIRTFVKNEDDLLKVAEDAAGGSLDKLKEIKQGWWEGLVDGKKRRIEWQPGGEASTAEGPHVKILEWVEGIGKKGQGKWRTIEKYFIEGYETFKE